ncbi:MAG TPA: hypothetical protein VM186_06695 [Planctomycetota bacterium]|nr:hypothetical protein [Planctomycetota bacterium]
MDGLTEKRGPSAAWFVVGAALILFVAIGIPAFVICTFVTSVSGGEQFLAPGGKAIEIDEPGEYTPWDDQVTFFQGRSYNSGPLPPNIVVRVTCFAEGNCHREPDEHPSRRAAVA